jgi:hypothetical protein
MFVNPVKQRLAQGKAAWGASLPDASDLIAKLTINTGVDFLWIDLEHRLAGHGAVFARGIEAADKLGDEISVDYLNREVQLPGGRWLRPQATSEVVALIHGLEEHLHGRT